jgi:hypothetical protein
MIQPMRVGTDFRYRPGWVPDFEISHSKLNATNAPKSIRSCDQSRDMLIRILNNRSISGRVRLLPKRGVENPNAHWDGER